MSPIALSGQLACDEIYDPITPGSFDRISRIGESVFGNKMVNRVLHLVPQGTELTENGKFSLDGWRADFTVDPILDPVLGHVHSGFEENISVFLSLLLPTITKDIPLSIEGHSKGAGEGSLLAARLKSMGYNVRYVHLFACPNSVYQSGADWYRENLPQTVSIRNAISKILTWGDPVPMVPPNPYRPPMEHLIKTNRPKGLGALIPTNWHQGQLYKEIAAIL